MLEIIGIAMLYSMIHSAVICFKKLTGLTQYEKVVCWVAFVSLVLMMIGIISE